MIHSFYESHTHLDPNFSIIFHPNSVDQCTQFSQMMHWHESIELIYFTEGTGKVICGPQEILANEGDLIVINPNELHRFESITEQARYYCLIVHPSVCDTLDLEISHLSFDNLIPRTSCLLLYQDIKIGRAHA